MKRLKLVLSIAVLSLGVSSCMLTGDPELLATLKKVMQDSVAMRAIDSIVMAHDSTNTSLKHALDSLTALADSLANANNTPIAANAPASDSIPVGLREQFTNTDFQGSMDGWEQNDHDNPDIRFQMNPNNVGIYIQTPGIDDFDNYNNSLYERSSGVIYQDGFRPGTYTIQIDLENLQPGDDAGVTNTGEPTDPSGTDIIYFADASNNVDVSDRLVTVMPGKSIITKTITYPDPSNLIGFNIYIKKTYTKVGLNVKINSIKIIGYESL